MLNPHGYTHAPAAGAENDKIMQSARSNITSNRDQVLEFIAKETNIQRRMALDEIFRAAEAIKNRFDGHKQFEIRSSADYKNMAIKLFSLIRKQRHAGRKLFFVSMSNPIFGFDVVTFFYYPTIRGIKSSQLELMDDYIAELKGTDIDVKVEPKPFGMNNFPRSESSRKSAGKKVIKIRHADLKNDIAASLASILIHHNVPVQWLDHNIDTSEMPNAFKKKANILLNLSLVVEMTNESIVAAVDTSAEEQEWNSTDGWFELEANRILNQSRNNNNQSLSMDVDNFLSIPKPRLMQQAYQDDLLINLSSNIKNNDFSDISSASSDAAPSDQKLIAPEMIASADHVNRKPVSSTPNASRVCELPRPNDSLASTGLPDEILEFEMIQTQPLTTPQPKKRTIQRAQTFQSNLQFDLDEKDEEIQNKSMPVDMQQAADEIMTPVSPSDDASKSKDSIASRHDIESLEELLKQMSNKFDLLEKSIKKN